MSNLNKLGVFLNQQFQLFQMPPFPSLLDACLSHRSSLNKSPINFGRYCMLIINI